MKSIFTLILLTVITALYSQKLPKPPKADAIGKESLWENFTKNNAFEVLVRTKKIAILPASAAYFGRKANSETVQQSQTLLNEISGEVQKLYFSRLYTKKLSAILQNPEETNRILGEKNLLNLNLLNKTGKNTLCFLLGVDAILFIDITMENLKSPLAEAAASIINPDPTTDEIAIGLRLYEKANGDFIWAGLSSEKKNSKETMSVLFNKLITNSIQQIPFVLK